MKLKKLASVFLAAVMAVSLATTAFAAGESENEQKGNITVINVHSGDRSLVAYRLFNASKSTDDKYGYTPNSTYQSLISGVLSDMDKSTDDILNTLSGLTNNEAVAFAHAVQEGLLKETYTPDIESEDFHATEQSGNHGIYDYKASGVDLGYYIIFDTAEGSAEYAPTFAMLTPANTNVRVAAKDSNVTASKNIDEDGNTDTTDDLVNTGNVNIGDTVTYKITGDIPAYASANNEQYEVQLTDTLPTSGQLQYIGIESVVLSGDGINKTFTEDNVVFKDKAGNTTTDMTKAVSFVFDKLLVDKANGIDDLNDESATITITYTAKVVDADAIVNENTNTYKYEYGNPTGGTQLTSLPEKQATVYTYGFKIFKYTGENTPLAGAEFSLKKGNTELKFTKTGDNYVYDPAGNVTTLVSDDDGSISILGLDADTYTLEETKAPDGYNLLANTIDVKITPKANGGIENADCTVSYKLTGTTGEPQEANDHTVEVLNTTGTQLPGTGGMGTTLFTAGGLLILCAAGAFLYFNRKRLFGR